MGQSWNDEDEMPEESFAHALATALVAVGCVILAIVVVTLL